MEPLKGGKQKSKETSPLGTFWLPGRLSWVGGQNEMGTGQGHQLGG